MPRSTPIGRIAENIIPSGGLPDGLSHRPAGIPLALSDTTMTPSDLLPEQQFLRALRVERKRAERSRRPFILMLVSPGAAQNGAGAALLRKAAAALVPAVRETDVAGWHTQDTVLGVIFVEPGTTDRAATLTALQRKMTTALEAGLSPAELEHLQVSFHCFPEDLEEHDVRFPAIAALYPDLVQDRDTKRFSRAVKRILDVLGSSLALAVLAPIMLAIALAIRVSSRGPVLFRQTRIGQYGIPFTFLKFRSMYASNDTQIHRDYVTRLITGRADACLSDTNGRTSYKITHDPRVTRLGRLLRRTSLDELPQLLNVLAGTMSLVGPRPPIPYEVVAYDVWHRRRLLDVKPGITGLWQVSGRSRRSFDDMVRLDLRYARAWSAALDIKILLKTPRAVISGEGAY
jgi:lipopolysaccharide/colanic/teichoic acid biosynthesis glycosyltransferase